MMPDKISLCSVPFTDDDRKGVRHGLLDCQPSQPRQNEQIGGIQRLGQFLANQPPPKYGRRIIPGSEQFQVGAVWTIADDHQFRAELGRLRESVLICQYG